MNRRRWLRDHVVTSNRPMRIVRCPGVGWSYAMPDGRLVLRDERRWWRHVNGFWVNTPWGNAWFMFRYVRVR